MRQFGVAADEPREAAARRGLQASASRARPDDLEDLHGASEALHRHRTERLHFDEAFDHFDGPKVFEVLARRMETVPGLRVTLLLNIQRRRGDTTGAEQLVRRFADRFWTTEWPGTSRPSIFYDPRALDPDAPSGVLHAKAVVADDEAVFVTSANLTEAALERNIELGLLLRDRALAASISSHFRVLIDRGLLRALPAA